MQLLTDWPDKQAAKFETSGISGKSYTPMQSLSHTLQFQFYSGDATDVSERLDHGSLDFAVMLQPIDSIKYEFLSLPDRSEWGILMTKKDPLASKKSVTKDDLKSIPLIMHQRIGLQSEIAHWAGTDLENLNIAATYNVVHGSPVPFVQQGLGVLSDYKRSARTSPRLGSLLPVFRTQTFNPACSGMEKTRSV